MENKSFPQSDGDIEEQRRLFYVAMTRAKERLFLCYATKRGGKLAQGYSFYDRSPFIYEIPDAYREFIRPNY
jgi:DNA helicase-2/ATP-dependent DNA helicase PcrA